MSGATDEVRGLASTGRYAEAVDRLNAAAASGDPDGLYLLGVWRISGQIIPRNTAAARALMGQAAEAGHRTAALLYANFLANGTGGSSDWKAGLKALKAFSEPSAIAGQLTLIGRMAVGDDGEPLELPELEELSREPSVWIAAGFLTDEECDYLVRSSGPRLQPSLVIDRATGHATPHPDRKSDSTFFGAGHEDLAVNAINRRIAAISGTRPEQSEPLQILSYGPGGEFRTHFDFVKEGGNQRIMTAIAYLTDDYEGGETRFVRTGLDFRGCKGDLLLFRNVTEDGRQDPMSEHAGLPVRSGTKIVASRWIWREPYSVEPPKPFVPGI
ncbi:MAG TPA: 2OG-Fe(II) oxygenase [Sphingomicrobium sp.]|nr:2OG-Fe(II) oxygenase [Sphingomicrobium sp.]